jgi:hypothetical protein
MTWKEFFASCKVGQEDLFSVACMAEFGSGVFDPTGDDIKSAARLHVQLLSRIATQKLDYLTGTEQAALTSLYQLFDITRKIPEDLPTAQKFERLAWDVLNRHLRPFTAKWHHECTAGTLTALDSSDEFRGELDRLQNYLRVFDQVLVHFHTKTIPVIQTETFADERATKIRDEMKTSVAWKIFGATGNLTAAQAAQISEAEKAVINDRRLTNRLDPEKIHATALAISGGGIRSATFSLGVVIALAKRGILPHFDYLSTVSGGGYLGSFISTYLRSNEQSSPSVGLGADESPFHRDIGETPALRHLRHRCSYLAAGSWKLHVRMMAAVFQGLVLNGLGLVLLAATLALGEDLLVRCTQSWWNWPMAFGGSILLALACFILTLVLARCSQGSQKSADWVCSLVLLWLGALLAAKGLRSLHEWFHVQWFQPPIASWWSRSTWLLVLGGVPVTGSLVIGAFGRILGRKGMSFIAWTASCSIGLLLGLYLIAYEWISTRAIALPLHDYPHSIPYWWILAFLATAWLIYLLIFDINYTSPHRHYRNSLADTFLIQPASDTSSDKPKFHRGVDVRLSALAQNPVRGPYHLINCTLNVPLTDDAAVQGRRADFFLFSPKFCGSPLTKYFETTKWEQVDPRLNVGTAMAISGAAASPLMGLGTMNHVRFWLALLNIRLGYWVQQPDRRVKVPPGLLYLFREMTGWIDEKSSRLNLSDGGHIENLGVYELLRRRCQYIVAIDGEKDHEMTFAALTTLQRLAAIDLDIKIEINLDDVRLNASGLSRSHFRLARIIYPPVDKGGKPEIGYLLYIKLSLTGNEGEFIRRYRLDEPVFPHHSTADQFFSEPQFEAYRSLGEHIGDKLFLKTLVGELGTRSDVSVEEWFRALGENLLEPR